MSRTVRPEVATFVAQVRACLSDLSPEEVEELTGGLDADLEERLEDTGPGTAPPDLGDPAAYADELRAAAGPGLVERIGVSLRRDTRPFVEMVERQPWWPQFRESVVALRPVWWVARAWVAWWLLQYVFITSSSRLLPGGLGMLLLLLLCVGTSVALGRGLLDRRLNLDRPWAPVLLATLNVFAALLLLPALSSVGSDAGAVSEEPTAGGGLVLDGLQVTNLFAYDAQGRPIPVVQLYDQNGRAVVVGHSEYENGLVRVFNDDRGDAVAPWVDDRGQERWNAFPVPTAVYPEPSYDGSGQEAPPPAPSASAPAPPLVAVPPVTGILGVPSSSPSGSSTGSLPSSAPSGPAVPGATTGPTSSGSAPASRTPAPTGS